MRQNFGANAAAFILGGLVGAGLTLFLAPRPGREMREKIKDLAEDTREKAEGYLQQARGQMTSVMEKGKEILQEKKLGISAAIQAGKEAFEKERERASQEMKP